MNTRNQHIPFTISEINIQENKSDHVLGHQNLKENRIFLPVEIHSSVHISSVNRGEILAVTDNVELNKQGESTGINCTLVQSGDNIQGVPKNDGQEYTVEEQEVCQNMVEENMTLIGSDVVALFPSLTADRTAKIIRKEIKNSEIQLEGLDLQRARVYIVINRDTTDDLKEIEDVLPRRKSKNGTPPLWPV